ncbi:transglutaminase-like domain-containing protein [Methanofollis fontis]|uniref:Transglutaminase n=1 Tax=Methanofollis fontis TaxID=2052832 RepID=A0A483CR11_9EURY|nr:transglutaminase domain-containing protein [Methanofollis fontis]TAJ45555.1 transglutaminase [Methanofollis fontis]
MCPNHPAILLLLLLLCGGAGCLSAPDGGDGDDLSVRAATEMADGNYRTAADLYEQAYARSLAAGDADGALADRNGMFRATRAVIEFPFNRSAAEAEMRQKVPNLTAPEMDQWLDGRAQTIRSDGEVLYYENIAIDFLYAHPERLHPIADRVVDFDYTSRYALAEAQEGALPYRNPVRYAGTERLDLPADSLPVNGTLRVWFPLPLETDSQQDVSVANLSHPEYIVTGPVTEGRIGYVYYEVPIEALDGDLVISADIAFTSYEQIFEVDPASVLDYDTSDPDYILYTSSSRNIEVTDGVRDLAASIAGNETNPCLAVHAVYRSIIDTYPYSQVPHASLDTVEPKVAESSYMLATGHGDCGTQSMLFAALCRSLGIPARAAGGYQMLLAETPGTHFWAEYYIEGYGWVPCDTTVAEIADWVAIPEEERERFKTYYADRLDPARLVIQTDVDAPMDPAIPDDAVVFRPVRQFPAVVCDGAAADMDVLSAEHFSIDLAAEG